MAGTGFDAVMISDADEAKDRVGRLAYVWSAIKSVRIDRVPTRIAVDGAVWFDGSATCVLIGNMGTISGGLVVFDQAKPDDGRVEVGVVTADGVWTGFGCSCASFVGTQNVRRSCEPQVEERSKSVSLADGSTSSMAVTANPSSTSKSFSNPPPSSSSFRR